MHRKTQEMIDAINNILAEYNDPLTLRQLYYRLVATHVIENTERAYKALSATLTKARRAGLVDAAQIVDRTRRPSRVSCWTDLSAFLETARRAYRREKWVTQERCVEVWIEKDALAGVLEPVTKQWEVTLYPCRGYNSYSALMLAAKRVAKQDEGRDDHTLVLYLGDFDPSGADMARDIRDRMADDFGATIELRVLALTGAQVEAYALPPAPAKRSDTRAAAFIAEHGDRAVELDALPPDALQDLVRCAITENLDITIWERECLTEVTEKRDLESLMS